MSDETLTPRQKMEALMAEMEETEREAIREVLAYVDSSEWQKVEQRFNGWRDRVRPAGPLDNAIVSLTNAINSLKLNFQAQAAKSA